ncbi:hypothetical protein I2F62_12840 [Acinetobacter sp. MD2(2019)]|nr:hypothetical protein [Acinetobacter sp. MD2(2019)]
MNQKKHCYTFVWSWKSGVAVVALPVVLAASAHAAEDNAIDMGSLGVTGISVAAATVFAIKASPSLMMWGYRKILGFIGR